MSQWTSRLLPCCNIKITGGQSHGICNVHCHTFMIATERLVWPSGCPEWWCLDADGGSPAMILCFLALSSYSSERCGKNCSWFSSLGILGYCVTHYHIHIPSLLGKIRPEIGVANVSITNIIFLNVRSVQVLIISVL